MKSMRRFWRALRKSDRAPGKSTPRLVVSDEAQDFITGEVRNFRRDVETGGILMGRIESATLIHVTHASGPGPDAVHAPSHFLRDTAYCAGVLREHYDQFGVDYVGEWHSHVKRLRRPSPGDLVTLHGIMNDPDYDLSIFAMLLAVGAGGRRPKIDLHGFIATRQVVMEVMIDAPV